MENYYGHTRIINRDKFEKFGKEAENFSNNIYIDLTKVLITLNTALLAFSSPVVKAGLLDNIVLKTLLVTTWVFLGLSVISGIIELIINHLYMSKISQFYLTLATTYNDAEATEKGIEEANRKMEIETQRSFQPQSSPVAFYFQIFFFITSLVLLIIIFSKVVF